MRALLLLLIAANALLYAVQVGAFGTMVAEGHDPGRLSQQIDADKIHLLSLGAPVTQPGAAAGGAAAPGGSTGLPASAAAGSGSSPVTLAVAPQAALPKPLACVEFGGFNADDARRADVAFAPLNLGSRLSIRHADDQATFIVYLPPFKTKADADRAAGELKRIGVQDFFVIQDPGPYHLAISLGIFHNEEAAKGLATSLSQQGVKNAKTGERPSTISKTYYQIRPADSALLARLGELRAQFPNEDLHECAASTVPDGAVSASSLDKVATSSSGT